MTDLIFIYGKLKAIPKTTPGLIGDDLVSASSVKAEGLGTPNADGGLLLSADDVKALVGDEGETADLHFNLEFESASGFAGVLKAYSMRRFVGKTPSEEAYENTLQSYQSLAQGGKNSVSIGGRSYSAFDLEALKKAVEELKRQVAEEKSLASDNATMRRWWVQI